MTETLRILQCLRALGMKKQDRIKLVRDMASEWLEIGRNNTNYQASLDTLFSKQIGETVKK